MPKLIVGLGNPGPRYAATRHNVGWMVLDVFAKLRGVSIDRKGYQGMYGEMNWQGSGEKVIFLRPLTYMNLSGSSVTSAVRFYKVDPSDMLVIYDDLDLPTGKLRLRDKGASGGHNGMKSIIAELGTDGFPRLKIGIGRPAPGWEVPDWVLSSFSPEERGAVDIAVTTAADAVAEFLSVGILKAMTRFNGL